MSKPNNLQETVLKALVTAPNCMLAKTINDKELTVFEVQNYNLLVDAFRQELQTIQAEIKAENATPGYRHEPGFINGYKTALDEAIAIINKHLGGSDE